jgi:HPt (histidine-containing phosphotransfer) domain-containing protein
MSTNLPILNYEFALNQLGGNEALLIKMLGRFTSEFADVGVEVSALVAENNFDSAKMKVHTVKGISGNLGLQALFNSASYLDAELRVGKAEQSVLNDFSQLVITTCSEIKKIDSEESESGERDLTSSPLSLQNSKEELIKRLQRNEFIDDETLNDLINGLQTTEAEAQSLTQLIEELQYPQAIEIIQKIER